MLQHVNFSKVSTRSSSKFKLVHNLSRFNHVKHIYFNRLPRLWNSLPTINTNQSVSTNFNYSFGGILLIILTQSIYVLFISVRYRVQGIYAIQKPEGHCSDPSAARALHGPRVFELRTLHGPRVFELRRSRRTRYLTCLVHSTRVYEKKVTIANY